MQEMQFAMVRGYIKSIFLYIDYLLEIFDWAMLIIFNDRITTGF